MLRRRREARCRNDPGRLAEERAHGPLVITTPAARKSDAARAMDGLRRLVRGLRLGNSATQRATGVSSAQLFVLRRLSRRSGQSLTDLAASTLTTQSSVSEVVSKIGRAHV